MTVDLFGFSRFGCVSQQVAAEQFRRAAENAFPGLVKSKDQLDAERAAFEVVQAKAQEASGHVTIDGEFEDVTDVKRLTSDQK